VQHFFSGFKIHDFPNSVLMKSLLQEITLDSNDAAFGDFRFERCFAQCKTGRIMNILKRMIFFNVV
jgi:hypothetical protein